MTDAARRRALTPPSRKETVKGHPLTGVARMSPSVVVPCHRLAGIYCFDLHPPGTTVNAIFPSFCVATNSFSRLSQRILVSIHPGVSRAISPTMLMLHGRWAAEAGPDLHPSGIAAAPIEAIRGAKRPPPVSFFTTTNSFSRLSHMILMSIHPGVSRGNSPTKVMLLGGGRLGGA